MSVDNVILSVRELVEEERPSAQNMIREHR